MAASSSELNFRVNPTGWGPTELPSQLVDVPYAPFSKTESIGTVADFIGVRSGKWKVKE